MTPLRVYTQPLQHNTLVITALLQITGQLAKCDIDTKSLLNLIIIILLYTLPIMQ
jgi:hypothetical protein